MVNDSSDAADWVDRVRALWERLCDVAVEKACPFDGPNGRASLLDLFEGRRQLIVYRFFYEPGVSGWPDGACLGCSMGADQVAHLAHLNARDTTLAYVSRAPQADIERLKARMGWERPRDEALGSTWSYLDITALGRQEEWEDSPDGYPPDRPYAWWRRHDEYGSATDPWEGRLDEKVALTKAHGRRTAGDAA